MSGETLQKPTGIFIRATITLKEYQSTIEASTQTITVSNFPTSGHDSTYLSGEFPILLDIADLSEEHDELMPRVATSSITISNKAESLGYQRRFSDLLEYYTINEQPVTITFHSYKQNQNDIVTGSALSTWALIANAVTVDLQRETVTISLKNNVLTDKVITKEITSSEFPNAPTSSIGRFLPLALGANVPVIATRISDTEHALTTTMGTTNDLGGVVDYYAKHVLGDYVKVTSMASTATYYIDAGVVGGVSATVAIGEGRMSPLYTEGWFIMDRLEVTCTGTSTASATGYLTVEILEARNGQPQPTMTRGDFISLGSASADKSTYSASINGTGDFQVVFNFEQPVIISYDHQDDADSLFIFVSIRDSNTAKPVNLKYYTYNDGNFGYEYNLVNDTWVANQVLRISPPRYDVFRHKAQGMVLTPTLSSVADDNGLGYSKVAVTKGYSDCDEKLLQLGAVVNGLETGGATSGYIYQILPMLFSSSEYDLADTFTSHGSLVVGQTYGRIIAGATSGRTTRLQLARELLKNSGCRLISLASTGVAKVALYAWGNTLTRQGVIDDRFMTTTKIGIGDRRTVINNITASYSKDVLNRNANDLLEQGGSTGFSKTLANQRLTGSSSVTLYGSNDLGSGNFVYINDDTSMTNMVAFYHRNYEHPYKFVEFYIPFAPSFGFPDSSGLVGTSLKCSQVVDLVTYQLPAFYGSSAKALNPVDDGELVVETSGYDFTRAKRYRVQIESKKITFIDDIPVLYFTCKILDNSNNPT